MPDILDGYGEMILGGLKLTIVVSVTSMIGAVLFGSLLTFGLLSPFKPVRALIQAYNVIFRGVPELVLLLLVYYGLPTLLQESLVGLGYSVALNINPFVAGIGTLSLIYGAFASQVLRGAYQAIPRGYVEAAVAFGLSRRDTTRFIILPQVFRYALPGLGNVWMVLLKATAIISIIQLPELMRTSNLAARATREPFKFFLVACVFYLVITFISMWAQSRTESWAKRGTSQG